MFSFVLYALCFGLFVVLLSLGLAAVLLPLYLWMNWRDAMAEDEPDCR